VDILRKPLTCFDASLYSILVLCDMEDVMTTQEIDKLEEDIRDRNLSVLVISDWFDEIGLLEGTIIDDNT
jgi:hypothetical protein